MQLIQPRNIDRLQRGDMVITDERNDYTPIIIDASKKLYNNRQKILYFIYRIGDHTSAIKHRIFDERYDFFNGNIINNKYADIFYINMKLKWHGIPYKEYTYPKYIVRLTDSEFNALIEILFQRNYIEQALMDYILNK